MGGGWGGAALPARPVSRQRREKLGVEGGRSSPRQTAMFNIAVWLPSAKPTRPPTLGNLCRQNLHTRTLRSPLRAVSTTEKRAMSQVFQRSPGCGSASGNGASIASRRA